MRYFLLVSMLFLIGGCVCKANKEITSVIVKSVAAGGECKALDVMAEQITPLVEAKDYCGDGFDTKAIIPTLPSFVDRPQEAKAMPVWSAKAMCCYSVIPAFKRKVIGKGLFLPDEWNCKGKQFTQGMEKALVWDCQKI